MVSCLLRLPPQTLANINVLVCNPPDCGYAMQSLRVSTWYSPKCQQNAGFHPICKLVRENPRETEKPPLRIWKNPNFKSGEQKKKPLDSEESRVNLLAEDEGFEPPQTESESGVLPLHKSSRSLDNLVHCVTGQESFHHCEGS